MEISEISKVSRFLNECLRRAENGFSVDPAIIAKDCDVKQELFDIAIRKGYFIRIKGSYYKTTISKFEPINCRDLILIYDSVKEIIYSSNVNNPSKCLHCGNNYMIKAHNQKFCCEECRMSNWMQKTGRKIMLHKK